LECTLFVRVVRGTRHDVRGCADRRADPPIPPHNRAMSRHPPREPHSSVMRRNSPSADLPSHDAAELFPFPRHSAHAAQSLGHPFPLCVGWMLDCASFSLGCRLPSTASAEGFPSLFGCFTGTTRQSDFSIVRTRPHCGFAPSRTGLSVRQPRWRPPGSRACCFSTCQGLRPRRVRLWLAILSPPRILPSH
jgi:hypothetical protein